MIRQAFELGQALGAIEGLALAAVVALLVWAFIPKR